MAAILLTLWLFVVDLFKSRSRLEAENLFLRHQLNIAVRRAPSHARLSGGDRALLVLMTKLWPNLVDMARLVQPETTASGPYVLDRWESTCSPPKRSNLAESEQCSRGSASWTRVKYAGLKILSKSAEHIRHSAGPAVREE